MASEEHGWKIFYAYADPEAGESGVIYSSLNWLRVSDTRATENYVLPDGEVISERTARHRKTTRAALIEAGAQIVKRPGKRKFVHFEGDRRERRALRQVLRYQDYDEEHCWQYDIRLRNRAGDLKDARLTEEQVAELTVHDFEIRPIFKPSSEWRTAIEFIKRHEWLGNMGKFPTHYFGAYYGNILAGVVVMGYPNASKDGTERLIQRGACVSWSPKYLASHMISGAMDWMVHNTEYRIFTCYSDPEAKELGTVYQACNFYYCGLTGDPTKYEHPLKPGEWLQTSRYFRNRRMYRVYAEQLGIEWDEGCGDLTCEKHGWDFQRSPGGGGVLWKNMPDEIEAKLRQAGRDAQAAAKTKKGLVKHRYVYLLGRDKRETRHLRRDFEAKVKTFPYPKLRGEIVVPNGTP